MYFDMSYVVELCGELSPCRKWPGRCTVLPPLCLSYAVPAGIIVASPSAPVAHFSPYTVHVENFFLTVYISNH